MTARRTGFAALAAAALLAFAGCGGEDDGSDVRQIGGTTTGSGSGTGTGSGTGSGTATGATTTG
jgi:hypothetical protein